MELNFFVIFLNREEYHLKSQEVIFIIIIRLLVSFFQMERENSTHTTLRVTGFEPDVFRQLMEFAHTGRVDLMPRTITGVICSADYYQFLGMKNIKSV